MTTDQMKEWAKLGAAVRLQAIEEEERRIRAAFPGIRASEATAPVAAPADDAQPRKRRRMSAAARARISAATKARWAKAKKDGKSTL